jgi:hypothetical protein
MLETGTSADRLKARLLETGTSADRLEARLLETGTSDTLSVVVWEIKNSAETRGVFLLDLLELL